MSKRLTERLETVEDVIFEEMGKEIEDIQKGLEENKGEISLDRIKALARVGAESKTEKTTKVAKIDDQREKIKQGKPKLPFKRLWIPLVAAVGLSVGAVAATHYSETLSGLFGQNFPYSEQVQSIGKSMRASGLIFTAEGAFVDEKTGLFVASFRKEDDTSFEPGTEVMQMQVNTQKRGSMGWSVNSQLSEDGKQLICVVDLASSKKLYGGELVLSADGLNVWRDLKAVSSIPLEKITQLPIEENWKNYDATEGLGEVLTAEFEEIILDRMNMSSRGLEIIASYADQMGRNHQSVTISLVNKETGEIHEPSDYDYEWNQEEGLNKSYVIFEGIQSAQLSQLAIQINNQYYEEQVNGHWQVGFKLDKNENVRTKKISQGITIGEDKMQIKQIEVSALGMTIEGYKLSQSTPNLGEVYLQMKDGSSHKLWQQGMNSNFGKINLYYKIQGEEMIQSSLESNQVEDSNLAGSVTFALESDTFNLSNFINVEAVESVRIGGINIPLE